MSTLNQTIQPGHATMIRFPQILAIGMALIGAVTPTSLGQTVGTPGASSAQVQTTQVAAPAQTRSATAAAPTTTAAENAVRGTVAAYIAAYNQKDVAKLVDLFTPDGTLIDSENVATRGRQDITQEFSEAFEERTNYTLHGDVNRIRLITPDVAQAEGLSRLVSPKEATIANHFVILLARQGQIWKIAEIRDYPAAPDIVAPSERLKELEWLIGDWIDEGEDTEVTSTVRWGQGKAYLVRDYSVRTKGEREPTASGVMIIAWDPQTNQIKSWIFNGDGSRGEASWTRATENQWVAKAHGTTADGRPTSATQVISLVNKDAVKTSSTDRVVGGEIARDIDDVIMVRKPPAPVTKPAGANAAPGARAPSSNR
jgi:uncharacterized protein (TIGR02246 family)